jgi:hypothetical protein
MDQDGGKGTEIRLDDLEEGVEIATFLAGLASVFLVIWAMVLPLMAVLANSNTAGPPRLGPGRLAFPRDALIRFVRALNSIFALTAGIGL